MTDDEFERTARKGLVLYLIVLFVSIWVAHGLALL
jgi:hypothetical protein